MQPIESGPFTYVDTLVNNGVPGGTYTIGCVAPTQLTCSVTPSNFHLNASQIKVLTISYSTRGLGSFGYSIQINASPDVLPGQETDDTSATIAAGPVTTFGPGIVQHLNPPDHGSMGTADGFQAVYGHASGIDTASVKLLLNGKDSSYGMVKTGSGYTASVLHPVTGYHTWTSYACALSGRCDSVTTTFTRQGANSYSLDDSLPPTSNPLGSAALLGPLPLPPTDEWGCALNEGDPEIYFTNPQSYVTQSTPNGRVFIAVIDTVSDTLLIRTTSLAWLPNQSRTCAQLSYLNRNQFDYSYFVTLAPNDPHWLTYPYGDLSLGPSRSRREQPLLYGAAREAFQEHVKGGPRVDVDRAWSGMVTSPTWLEAPERRAAVLLPRSRSVSVVRAMLPDPGPIDSTSWHVVLNGTTIIDHSAAVPGNGITGIVAKRLTQQAKVPVSSPAFHSITSGGWNEMIASISDTAGHTTSVRVRFVHDAHGVPGSPAPLAIASQRDFTHLDQGSCAAFAAFQCEGVVLAYAIPTFVTRDKPRDIHLIYRSASQRAPTTIPLQLTIMKTQKAPDTLWVIPSIAGAADSGRITRYNGVIGAVTGPNSSNLNEDANEVRIVGSEIAAPASVGADIRQTKMYVRSWFVPGFGVPFKDDSISQDVVQTYLSAQTDTRFGQGWQLAELGRLIFTGSAGGLRFKGDTAAIWLSGDGSYSVFRKPGAVWLAPPGETSRLVRLTTLQSSARFVLYLETGAAIGFRDDGWQVWTKDLAGNFTTFTYASGTSNRLDAIADPAGKTIKFSYFTTSKVAGYPKSVQVQYSATASDTATVATFAFDTLTDPTAVRLARIKLLRTPSPADSTRFTYKVSPYGAYVDSVIDPRHTASKPVVSRFTWDTVLWTPETLSRPLGGLSQARQIWRRASPRIGYGRRQAGPGSQFPERMVQVIQWVGTQIPFAGTTTDYTVDRFGGPTYVRDNANEPDLFGSFSADVRNIVRDTLTGLPLRVVHNRYEPTEADSIIYHYDALSRVDTLLRTTLEYITAQTRTLDTLTFTYDSLTVVTSANWCSRLKTATDAMRQTTTIVYNSSGLARCLPWKIVGIATDTTIFTYGTIAAGNPWSMRPVKVRDPNGNPDSVSYHTGTWNSEKLVEPFGLITRAFYDKAGRPDSILDPAGKPTWFVRDRSGRVIASRVGKGSLAPATHTTYDPGGLVTQTDVYTAPDEDIATVPGTAQTTRTYFDQLGRADSVITPGGRSVSPTGYKARKQSWFLRDGFGNPHLEYSGNGSSVSRVFDAWGRVSFVEQSQVWSGFSADGERFADAASKTWYESLLLPMGEVLNAGVTHSYTYDGKGRLVSTGSRDAFLGDTSYANRTYEYSRSDQLITEKVFYPEGGGATVVRRYEYNRRGQRKLATDTVYASGVAANEKVGRIRFVWDTIKSRLDSIVGERDSLGTWAKYGAVAYTYDRGGRETQRTVKPWASGTFKIITTTTYDSLDRVMSINTSNSTGTVHYSLSSPVYDSVSNLKTFTSTEPSTLTTGAHQYIYTTDGTRRLLSASEGGLAHSWTYDVFGNRLTETASASIGPAPCGFRNHAYDADNRLMRRYPTAPPTSVCTVIRTWTDQAGNRLGEADTTAVNDPGLPPVNGLQSIMTYTAGNQLYFSATPTGDVGHYDVNWHWYDPQGRRIMSQLSTVSSILPYPDPNGVGGFRTYYIYDGNDVALELVRSGGTWSVDRRMLSGGLDRPLTGRFKILGAYQNIALIGDQTGSIIKAVKPDGTAETSAPYFPHNSFGALIGVTGSGGSPMGGVGYTGAATPNATGGFVYLRNRWYDPQTGRFLTQDPIGRAGGVNLYAYAGNNPIAFDDPFGLGPEWIEEFLQEEGPEIAAAVEEEGGRISYAWEELGTKATNALRGSLQSIGSKLNNIVGHVADRDHLSTAAQEAKGTLETGYDHVTETRHAMNGLQNTISRLNGILTNPKLTDEIRKAAIELLSKASKALDAMEKAIK